MIGRNDYRLEKVELAILTAPQHLIICCDVAEIEEAKLLLGDRFGDLIFIVTGVPRGLERREEWLSSGYAQLVLGKGK